MPNHYELAIQIVHEQLEKRKDAIGAIVCGSVARGEATDTSDIDVTIYIKDKKDENVRAAAGWREGIFVETQIRTINELDSLEAIMGSVTTATRIRDALILHDSSGFLKKVQAEVRTVFMEHHWLGVRIKWALDYYRTSLEKLGTAIMIGDLFGICGNAMQIPHKASAVPLYIAGIAPSSTRHLFLLEPVSPSVLRKVMDFECSLNLGTEDVNVLHHICGSYCKMMDRKDFNGLPDYILWKAHNFYEHGQLREVIDLLWSIIGMSYPKEENNVEAATLVDKWLSGVGWHESISLDEKLNIANQLLNEIEAMAEGLA